MFPPGKKNQNETFFSFDFRRGHASLCSVFNVLIHYKAASGIHVHRS